MKRFDVFRNESAQGSRKFPFFLVLQSDLLQQLTTAVVAPLGRASIVGGKLVDTLAPVLDIDGESFVLYTPELAAIPAAILRKRVANLDDQREKIVRAVDFLFSGI
jgi:toxin CcdB